MFADEGQYRHVLEHIPGIDGAVLISASGEKDAPAILDDLLSRGFPVLLLTCVADSTAAKKAGRDRTIVTPARPEPLTYNTSTYLGMVLASTGEGPPRIRDHIESAVAQAIPSELGTFRAYYLMLPSEFDLEREMFLTKFDELFGGRINGRCFSDRQTTHAKTVVPWEKELVITFGCESAAFDQKPEIISVPVPDPCGHAAMIAIGYYTIGRIQEQNPPWFFEHIDAYAAEQKKLFRRRLLSDIG